MQAGATGTSAGVKVTVEGSTITIDGPNVAPSGETAAAVGLLPAMAAGTRLQVDAPVDPQFLAGVDRIQQILSTWFPDKLRPVEVHAPRREPQEPAAGVACFFSGGVDSYATVLRHPEVTHLVLVHGFDMGLDEHQLRAETSRHAAAAASDLGLPLIEVETDIRKVLDVVPWGTIGHGAAMAAVAHALRPTMGRVFIGSSFPYEDLFPWGSHPALDPRWSSEDLTIDHDGCDMSRMEKVALIAQSDTAMRHLRVCWANPDEAYNCGRCEKCLRTMIELLVVGALDRCATLPSAVDPTLVASVPIVGAAARKFAVENARAVEPINPAIAAALQSAIKRGDDGLKLHRRIRDRLGRELRRLRP